MRFLSSSKNQRFRPRRQAFTLMEVIISLAVLGMSMVAIGTLIQIGGQNALQARILTNAQFLAETKLSEVKAGIISPTATRPIPFPPTETNEPVPDNNRPQTPQSQRKSPIG